jgi:pyruvate dehydrogenase E2 component (dihydrolipoamide acetyltransferase)
MSAPQDEGLRLDLPPWPNVDFSLFGEVETVPLSRIQLLTAGYLARNWVAIPHVTHHDEVDITALEAFRKRLSTDSGVKLSALPFIVKAMAGLLMSMPKFNASLDATGKQLILKKYAHVGIAVDAPSGLLVAVVRDCDKKGVLQIAQETAEMASRARQKGLPMKDMVGGCMTVSSLGHIGGTAFTPIVNAPEVAILGVTKAQWKPQRPAEGGAGVNWRLMLPISLSYDHRVINGADAARFTAALAATLARPEEAAAQTG